MLAVTAGAFLMVTWVATKGLFFSSCSKIHCVEDDAKHLNRLPKALIKSP